MKQKTLLITFLSLLSAMSSFADNISPARVGKICYSVNYTKQTARVIEPIIFNGQKIEYEGDIVIPEAIQLWDETFGPVVDYVVTEIADGAFANDVTTSIEIPGTIDFIPDGCFTKCTNLRSVYVRQGVEKIGLGAFAELKHLESFTYNCTIDELTVGKQKHGCVIEPYAFYGCSALTNVNFGIRRESPSTACGFGVTVINEYAFEGCNNLKSITIPDKMAYIAPNAFTGAYNLEVHIADLSAWCNIEFGGPIWGFRLYLNGEEVKDLVLPYGITSIGNWAFCNCWNLTSVTIPESVVSIGESAFSGCEFLPSINIPSSVTSIGAWAFARCSALTSVNIPSGVTNIGKGTFSGCSALTSINIPSGVTSIGEWAFDGCSALEAVHISDLSAWCKISYAFESGFDDAFYDRFYSGRLEYTCQPLYYAHHLYLNNQEITDLIIPEDVTSISYFAFAGCSSLTSVTIPSNVKSIGIGAFYQCGSLTKIIVPDIAAWCDISFGRISENPLYFIGHLYSDAETEITNLVIPEGVTSIGDMAFYGCIGLKSVTIPEGVTSIGSSSFGNCYSLTSVTFPESVARIDSFAFSGCALTDIKIPKSTTFMGKWAFDCYRNLTSVKVEEGNTIYDSRDGCNAIIETATNTLIFGCKNTIIPQSITSIGSYAFYYCNDLTSIIIPDGVTNIGYGAFFGCSGLTDVYCLAEIVPEVNGNQIGLYWEAIEENATLYVPASALDAYKTTSPWSNFGTIVALTEDEIDGINEVESSKLKVESSDGKWYDLSGRQIVNSKSSNSKFSRGINIIRMSDGTIRKVLVK